MIMVLLVDNDSWLLKQQTVHGERAQHVNDLLQLFRAESEAFVVLRVPIHIADELFA